MNAPDRAGIGRTRAEPAIKAPWPLILLIAILVTAHAARTWLGVGPDTYALTAPDLAAGRWSGLVTHLFVHANWTHVLMNCVFILAFGAPVSRFLGVDLRGAALFWLFFILCGVIAGGGYAAVASSLAKLGYGGNNFALVGASGAASGFMGAAARLIEGRGRLGPFWGRTVVGMSVVWIFINAVLGLTGLTPGTEGAPVAWETHIIGYFAGLFLISPFAWAAGATADTIAP